MSLKLKWIGRIMDETNTNLKFIPKSQLCKIGGLPLCLNYSLKFDHINYVNKMSPFNKEIYKAWCVLNNKAKQNRNTQCGILNEVIWYNSNITKGKKHIIFKGLIASWYCHNIRDKVDESGVIPS